MPRIQPLDSAVVRGVTPQRQQEPDLRPRRSRSVDERRTVVKSPAPLPPPPLMSVEVPPQAIHASRYRSDPPQRGSGFKRAGRGRGFLRPQHRESVLNRLGPKMQVMQRLGSARGRPNRPSASQGSSFGRYFLKTNFLESLYFDHFSQTRKNKPPQIFFQDRNKSPPSEIYRHATASRRSVLTNCRPFDRNPETRRPNGFPGRESDPGKNIRADNLLILDPSFPQPPPNQSKFFYPTVWELNQPLSLK